MQKHFLHLALCFTIFFFAGVIATAQKPNANVTKQYPNPLAELNLEMKR